MNLFTVEFRIENDFLVPNDITKLLELSPCLTSDMLTHIKRSTSRTPFWAFDGISNIDDFHEQKWDSIEEGLLFLSEKLLPKIDLIQSHFDEYKLYWWCAFFQDSIAGELRFSPNLLEKLSLFNAELIISTYQSDKTLEDV